MDIRNILVLYTQQLTFLRQLLENAKDKRTALIATRHEQFELTMHKEEKLLSLVQETEKQRSNVIAEFLRTHFPDLNARTKVKLSKMVAGKIPPAELAKLEGLELSLRNIIGELTEENSNNLFLLQHMRNFYADTMQALMGKSLTAIVDRKV